MKTLKILVILSIIFSYGLKLIKAQVPQKISYHAISGIKSLSTGNPDTTYNRRNTSGLSGMTIKEPAWINISENPGFTFIVRNRNYFNLINKPALSEDNMTGLTNKPIMPGFGNSDTLKGKLGILIWRPDFTTSINYYHSTRTNNPSLYNSGWYRLAGNIFNMYTETKYRIPSAPNR